MWTGFNWPTISSCATLKSPKEVQHIGVSSLQGIQFNVEPPLEATLSVVSVHIFW